MRHLHDNQVENGVFNSSGYLLAITCTLPFFFLRSTFVSSAWSFIFFIPATTANDRFFFIYENSYNVYANVIAYIILGDTISWSLFVLPSLIRSLNSHLICTLNFSMKFNQWVINSSKIILKLNNIFSEKIWLQLFHSFKLYFVFWKFRIFH